MANHDFPTADEIGIAVAKALNKQGITRGYNTPRPSGPDYRRSTSGPGTTGAGTSGLADMDILEAITTLSAQGSVLTADLYSSLYKLGTLGKETNITRPYFETLRIIGKTDAAADRFYDRESSRFANLQDSYVGVGDTILKFQKDGKDFNALASFFPDSKEVEDYMATIQNSMISTMPRSLETLDEMEGQLSAYFGHQMTATAAEVSGLLERSYALDGETSTKILTDIASHSNEMAKITGLSMKDIGKETIQILNDMETFGNIGVDSATRVAAALKQTGLSLGSFKGLVAGFRDFDSAADKMGDLSAMFGVQMDAMEMMYLANEDEEEFLYRFREQMLNQGVDLDNMSKTRVRALSRQVGVGEKELRTYLRTGEMVASKAEAEEASAKASLKTSQDAINLLGTQRDMIEDNTEQIQKMMQLKQAVAYRDELRDINLRFQDISGTLRSLKIPLVGEQEIKGRLGDTASVLEKIGLTASDFKDEKKRAEFINRFEGMWTSSKAFIIEGLDQLVSDETAENAGHQIGTKVTNGITEIIRKNAAPNSIPLVYIPLLEGLTYLAGSEMNTKYLKPTADALANNLSNNLKAAPEKINDILKKTLPNTLKTTINTSLTQLNNESTLKQAQNAGQQIGNEMSKGVQSKIKTPELAKPKSIATHLQDETTKVMTNLASEYEKSQNLVANQKAETLKEMPSLFEGMVAAIEGLGEIFKESQKSKQRVLVKVGQKTLFDAVANYQGIDGDSMTITNEQ